MADALRRIGGIPEPPLEPITRAVEVFHYRNKLEYSFTATPDGPALGFHRAGRWDEVLDIRRCWLTTDLGNALQDAVRDWARAEGLEAYDQAEHTGYLRHLVIREGRNTGQALVQLVTAAGEKFDRDEFVEVLRRFPEVRSVHWAVNDTPAEVTNLPTTLLWGEDAIEEELCGLRFRVRPNAFLQTNTGMAERLYALAGEYAALTGNETVYDLYCGIGTIGLTLASKALTVWGVEVSEESVAGALEVVACDLDPLAIAACRANAELNDVQLDYSTDFFAEADRFDLILVADVLYDRANLPLLDEFLSRGKEALVADSRVRDFRHPLYQRIEMLEAMTLPDLAEPHEFRHVSLYHASRP